LNESTLGAPAIGPNETNPVRNAATISLISLFERIHAMARRQAGTRSGGVIGALLRSDFAAASAALGMRISNTQKPRELNTACSLPEWRVHR